MSKKAAAKEPVPVVVTPQPVQPSRANIAEAMERFAPFVFTIDTDTRETTELRPIFEGLARDATLAGNYFPIDRNEVCTWYSQLPDTVVQPPQTATTMATSVNSPNSPPGQQQQQQQATTTQPSVPTPTEVKAQLTAIVDGNPSVDPNLIAQAIYFKIQSHAVEREEQRLEELEQITQRHVELVERLMDEGLTRREAEKAAREEEEAAALEEEGVDKAEVRPMAFVHLKGFPLTIDHLLLLQKKGIHVNVAANLHCKGKFGRRDEAQVVDPKAKGKKVEPKKAEAKKGGKGGKGEDLTAVPQEILCVAIQKAMEKAGRFDIHPLSDVYPYTYQVPCAESASSTAEEKAYDVQESEGEVVEKMINKIIELELNLHKYKEWHAKKQIRKVPRLDVIPSSAETNSSVPPTPADGQGRPGTGPANAQQPPPPPAAKAPPPKKGGKGAAAVKEEAPPPEPLAPPPPVKPPFPHSMSQVLANDELYRRLMDEVSPSNASIEILMHCLLEQVSETTLVHKEKEAAGNNGEGGGSLAPTTSSALVADTIASKNKKDVADFVDYVLAQLNGTDEQVFEQCRKKRLKAAEAMGILSQDSENEQLYHHPATTPLNTNERIALLPFTKSKTDPEALLLGVPLHQIESQINATLFRNVAKARCTVIPTDVATIKGSFAQGVLLARNLLTDRCHSTPQEAQNLLNARHYVERLSPHAMGERLAEILLLPNPSKVYFARCEDGTGVLLVLHPFPLEHRKRWRAHWDAFHGNVSFPRWIEWLDHTIKEDRYFNPPPRDEDEEEPEAEEPPQEEEAPEEEEEEEEEDEENPEEDDEDISDEEELERRRRLRKKRAEEKEDEDDDDGEKKKKKKKKKKEIVRPPPEYVPFDATQIHELRRRVTMEHLKHRLLSNKEELLHADNHTAHMMYEEESFMFPVDGSVIRTTSGYINTETVHCSVTHPSSSLLFGFRATTSLPTHSITSEGRIPSGCNAVLSVGNDATFHIEASIPLAQSVQTARSNDSGAQAESPVKPTAPPPDPKKGGTVAQPTSQPPADPSPSKTPSECSSPSHQEPPVTWVRCATKGLSIQVHPSGAIFFKLEAPRECSITVYNPTTQQIMRLFTSEVSRWVLPDGTVLATYSDGSRMNLFPNGNTAVYHKDMCMITNNSGKRILKHSNGKITPLVVSLVTSHTDVDTQSKVTTREDGVIMALYDDGRMLVQHVEGTRMWQDAQRRVVEIETEGMPLVCGTTPSTVPQEENTPEPFTGTPERESGRRLLCVKFPSGLYLSVRPEERATIGHFHMGFQCLVDYTSLMMTVQPSQEYDVKYMMDYAFGGLRCFDDERRYDVTPRGRTRARPMEEIWNEKIVPEDPTVRQVLEVFVDAPEILHPPFVQAAQKAGFDISDRLHMKADLPDVQSLDEDIVGFAPPPRSRQMREKERTCAQALRQLTATSVSSATEQNKSHPTPKSQTTIPPHIFFIDGSGGGVELLRKSDIANFVKASIAHSDLLHSDVFVEELGAAKPTTPASETKPPSPNTSSRTKPNTPSGGARVKTNEAIELWEKQKPHHFVVSIAPPKPPQRAGIPKIILDIRSGGSGVPMTVPHFLQELRQGPSHASGPATSSDPLDPTRVVCTTRHFMILPGALVPSLHGNMDSATAALAAALSNSRNAESSAATDDEQRLLSAAMADGSTNNLQNVPVTAMDFHDAIYGRVLEHLSRAIPPVIAAQLSVQHTAAILAHTREGRSTRGHDRTSAGHTAHSRGSRGTGDGKDRVPFKKRDPMQDYRRAQVDAEFAQQMERMRQDDRKARKEWPTPIQDLHKEIDQLQGSDIGDGRPNFWAQFGSEQVPELQEANKSYTSTGGYQKEPRDLTPSHGFSPEKLREKIADPAPSSARDEKNASSKLYGTGTKDSVVVHPHLGTHGGITNTTMSSSTTQRRESMLPPPKVVATPPMIDFGVVMEGFRYATSLVLTSVSQKAARFRLEPTDECRQWIKLEFNRAAIAVGMSTKVALEVTGNQALGEVRGELQLASEGGNSIIPIRIVTKSGEEGPISALKSGIRMIGPMHMQYKPNTVQRLPRPQKQELEHNSDSD